MHFPSSWYSYYREIVVWIYKLHMLHVVLNIGITFRKMSVWYTFKETSLSIHYLLLHFLQYQTLRNMFQEIRCFLIQDAVRDRLVYVRETTTVIEIHSLRFLSSSLRCLFSLYPKVLASNKLSKHLWPLLATCLRCQGTCWIFGQFWPKQIIIIIIFFLNFGYSYRKLPQPG
jgi:hypothetical protein